MDHSEYNLLTQGLHPLCGTYRGQNRKGKTKKQKKNETSKTDSEQQYVGEAPLLYLGAQPGGAAKGKD